MRSHTGVAWRWAILWLAVGTMGAGLAGDWLLSSGGLRAAEPKTGPAMKTPEAEEDDSETTAVIDLVKAGLFKKSPGAVQGRTRGGRTIADAPPFRVVRRKENLENYPCSDCHEDEPANPRERKLTEEHEDIVLEHGQGRFWCLTCHGTKDKDALASLKGKPIDFDFAFALCGQCHFQRQKDWYFGAHGKRMGAWPKPREIPATYDKLSVTGRDRIGRWQGTRVIMSCPACHDSHSPSIKPYRASPPPKPRMGLSARKNPLERHPPVWERLKSQSGKP